MPEYLSPGVYVEEIEIGPKPIEGVSTSTAGFLGETERGPTRPYLVTSVADFQRVFGGFIDHSYLAYAVDGFFRNGGQRCYIGRIVRISFDPTTDEGPDNPPNAETASSEHDSLVLKAIGPGNWGHNIAYKIEKGSLEKKDETDPEKMLFKLTLIYWSKRPPASTENPTIPVDPTDRDQLRDANRREPSVLEVYDNLSHLATSPDFFKKRVNGISNLVKLDFAEDDEGNPIVKRPDNTPVDPTDPEGKKILLKAFVDYSLPPDEIPNLDGAPVTAPDYNGKQIEIDEDGEKIVERSGILGFEHVDEISIVCAPDEVNLDGLTDLIVDHCEDLDLRDRFAILQSKLTDVPGNIGNFFPPRDSKYAAFYYPWIKILDPKTNRDKLIPPGGHIAGIYARSDIERGVHKAPANEIVRGARSLQFSIGKGQQDILNPLGINVIRSFPGRGIRVWGARTTSSDPLWKYVNVRRLFLFLEESIDEGTQWVVFEPNNEQLWARVKQTITQFLTTVWRTGALMGTTPEEAFFVKADRTTMTQDDIDNGRLIVVIGVAPTKPAEFVIFRIAQFTAGAENA